MQVGKHLGNVQNALPLRSVCRDWSELVTLTSLEADLDLEPDVAEHAASRARKDLFYKRCPRIRKLTYHVSPRVSLAKVSWLRHGGEEASYLVLVLVSSMVVPTMRLVIPGPHLHLRFTSCSLKQPCWSYVHG